MSLFLSEDDLELRSQVRDFVSAKVRPLVGEAEEAETTPDEFFDRMASHGFLAMRIPRGLGGAGATLTQECLVVEEVSAAACGLASAMMPLSLVAHLLSASSEPEGFQDILSGIVSGDVVTSIAITEPGAGSDVKALRTTVSNDGGSLVLNGTKTFITNAPMADVVAVLARSPSDAVGDDPYSMVIVKRGDDGYSVRRKLGKVGNRSSTVAEIELAQLRADSSRRIPFQERSLSALLSAVTISRVVFAARALGVAKAAFRLAVEYSKQRRTFGKALAEHQAIAMKLADMSLKVSASEALTYKASKSFDAGRVADFPRLASEAKLISSEAAEWISRECMQTLGGYGYMREFDAERYWRDARLLTLSEGTSEIQRMTISGHVTGLRSLA